MERTISLRINLSLYASKQYASRVVMSLDIRQ